MVVFAAMVVDELVVLVAAAVVGDKVVDVDITGVVSGDERAVGSALRHPATITRKATPIDKQRRPTN